MFMSLHTLHTCQSLKLIELNAEAAAGFLNASERESLRQNIICPIPTVSIRNSPPAASFRHRSSRCSNKRYGNKSQASTAARSPERGVEDMGGGRREGAGTFVTETAGVAG